jgi:hypothetical protein
MIITSLRERTVDGMEERVQFALLSGLCCSQVIAKLCLEDLGKTDECLVASMKAFCNGMEEGNICGTLAAAAAMIHVAEENPHEAARKQQDLMDWFYDRYGSHECKDLEEDNPIKKIEFCPPCVNETYLKLCDELL